MNILIEATDSLISGYLIKSIQKAKHKAICTDISDFEHSFSKCDEFCILPEVSHLKYWEEMEKLLDKHSVDIVIPRFDKTLITWSNKKEYFRKKNIYVI